MQSGWESGQRHDHQKQGIPLLCNRHLGIKKIYIKTAGPLGPLSVSLGSHLGSCGEKKWGENDGQCGRGSP